MANHPGISADQVVKYSECLSNGHDKAQTTRNMMRFMCTGVGLIFDAVEVAVVASRALSVAHRYWMEGKGTHAELVDARLSCWKFLDAKGRQLDIRDSEDAAIRALCCILYPERLDDDFISESFEWFFEMVNKTGDFSLAFEKIAWGKVSEVL